MRRILITFSRSFHSLKKMDNTLTEEVTKLLQRLTKAERRSKLLKLEIKDIRKELSTLTNVANGLLNNGTTVLSSRPNNVVDPQPGTSKRRSEDQIDSNNLKRNRQDFNTFEGCVTVFTDGACESNGRAHAKAGIGVWFGENHPLNISRPVVGRATNNTAEIQACVAALQCLQNEGVRRVKVYTDSQFTINCITNWIKKWKKNNWRLVTGGPVKNKEDLETLDRIITQFDEVKWEHVAGHAGIRGNEEADKLARHGASLYQS